MIFSLCLNMLWLLHRSRLLWIFLSCRISVDSVLLWFWIVSFKRKVKGIGTDSIWHRYQKWLSTCLADFLLILGKSNAYIDLCLTRVLLSMHEWHLTILWFFPPINLVCHLAPNVKILLIFQTKKADEQWSTENTIW